MGEVDEPGNQSPTVRRSLVNLSRSHRKVENLLGVLAGVVVCLMALAVTFDAGGRYLFSAPIVGMTELVSLYGMVLAVWLGAPLAQRTGANITVDILADRLPPRLMAVIDRINSVIAAGACLYMSYSMAELGVSNLGRSKLGGFDLPTAPPYFVLAGGAALLAVRILVGGIDRKSHDPVHEALEAARLVDAR